MSMTTTLLHGTCTITPGGNKKEGRVNELLGGYLKLVEHHKLGWTEHLHLRRGLGKGGQQHKLGWTENLHLRRVLGKGGQGIVYLSERRGADNFTLPVALKFFSPERYPDERTYREAMERMAAVSSQVAQIQHDNVLDVQNFIERGSIRVLEMEWVDGYDLDSLLEPGMLGRAKARVGQKRWDYINNVIATAGEGRTRLKPGIAVAIIRECLAGLAALHRQEIVHGDIKPSNIMVKRTGNAKIIDIGSALQLTDMPQQKTCTPQYAAPEMLDREEVSPRSDLASVGYVLVELLAGRPLFADSKDYATLLDRKRTLPQWLHKVLPPEVRHSELLMTICRRLTNPDPMLRYATAEQADTGGEGLAEFQRTLVRGDLASEYENELRVWLEELD